MFQGWGRFPGIFTANTSYGKSWEFGVIYTEVTVIWSNESWKVKFGYQAGVKYG